MCLDSSLDFLRLDFARSAFSNLRVANRVAAHRLSDVCLIPATVIPAGTEYVKDGQGRVTIFPTTIVVADFSSWCRSPL